MPQPKKVKVGPHVYKVTTDTEAMGMAEANGTCLNDTLHIYLSGANALTVTQETLLHEVLHAVWSLTALGYEWPDADKDSPGEKIIAHVAGAMLQVLKDNPELVKYLLEKG